MRFAGERERVRKAQGERGAQVTRRGYDARDSRSALVSCFVHAFALAWKK